MLNAVGTNVSKGKSTITVPQSGGISLSKAFDGTHSFSERDILKDYILSLDGETRTVMECIGHYHAPILYCLADAGIFVAAVNPHLIRNFGNTPSARSSPLPPIP